MSSAIHHLRLKGTDVTHKRLLWTTHTSHSFVLAQGGVGEFVSEKVVLLSGAGVISGASELSEEPLSAGNIRGLAVAFQIVDNRVVIHEGANKTVGNWQAPLS